MDRGDEVRALINLRCRNLEDNKYWLEKSRRNYIWRGTETIWSIMWECEKVKGKFTELGEEGSKVLERKI